MSWNAKPSGSYQYDSKAGTENIFEINAFFNTENYTIEAQSGLIGNVMAESGLNPWRWQSDTVNLSGGYGLFQFTPASGYIDLTDVPFHSPNLSTSEQTSGATVNDGEAQLIVFNEDRLGKWISSCWRTYWDVNTYAQLYAERKRILNTYGNGSKITLNQFKTIKNVWDATFTFLACYEGPRVPNVDPRYENAVNAYELLTGNPPDPPIPPTPVNKKLPIWFYIKHL